MMSVFTKQTSIGPWLGLSNEVICILEAGGAENMQEIKVEKKNVASSNRAPDANYSGGIA